jgi:acyl-homoserine-lactone acylase
VSISKQALILIALSLASAATAAQPATPAESASLLARWQRQARAVTVTRDDWGIAHISGSTDAEAVFGMIYAQAEDDFNRVETNYLTALGRTAEAEGESAIYADLRQKLFVDPADLRKRYGASPQWLKLLMNAWADGLNYYLYLHPEVTPRVIRKFEPWMALSFTEGSIGGDIERVSLGELAAFYGRHEPLSAAARQAEEVRRHELAGSNGIAIAPGNTSGHHALLLINPHTSFFFRSELQMSSREGLNAYGASTWGQFFIYQGFNERIGWMHTSTGADNVDEFAESIVHHGKQLLYRYGKTERPVTVSTIHVPYRTASGARAERLFTVYRTHHGPIVRAADGKWISVALMYRPVPALSQSFLRTKAHDYQSYLKVAELKANSSNNTIFADADGDIAYLHPQFMPRRDDHFDYTHPVDGSNPDADWKGEHRLDELPHVLNPPNGWIANTNNWPYSVAGQYSPRASDFPRYMDTAGENARGLHAALVLKDRKDFTLQSLIGAAFDSYLTAFARLIPALTAAYDQLPATDPLRERLAGQVELLRTWDDRWSADSEATSLAVFWGERLWDAARKPAEELSMPEYDYVADRVPGDLKLKALADASDRLVQDFGSWRVKWGAINRYQRNNGDIVQKFDDEKPSTPVPFTASTWGSLASFKARRYEGTRRYYGTSGNSFVAVVEFGDKVHAMAVTAGGESGHPASPHFDDEAVRYATGALREVYFYPQQLQGHAERTYHPGE